MQKKTNFSDCLILFGAGGLPTAQPSQLIYYNNTNDYSTSALTEQNKKIVVDFYEGVFSKHQVQTYF